MRLSCTFLAFVTLLKGLQSAHWATTVDDVIYACEGDTVTLPWRYTLNTGDTVNEIEWYYKGISEELIAIQTHGNFVPLAAFGNRVVKVSGANAGLTLSHVITSDGGNFTAVVNGYDSSGTHFELRQSVIVQISDQLMTQDGYVHVTMNPEAVLDTTTDQWSIQLQCGVFTFQGEPPYTVLWETPSGQSQTSSNFTNGYFTLELPNPMQGGKYTCRVPAQHLANTCLHGNNTDRREASVQVDRVEARLTLLEKENQVLKQRLQQTGQRVDQLESSSRKRVSFQAVGLANTHPSNASPLHVNSVEYNQGNAYNRSTGYFTAPFDGIYFFIGTSGSRQLNAYAYLYLYAESNQIDYVRTYDDGGHLFLASVHGTVHLNVGDRVYLRSHGEYYDRYYTTFTGFLLSPDP